MARLAEVLTDSDKRASVVSDCLQIIESEVADKGGLSGMAIKAGYKAVRGVKPGFLQKVVDDLLPEFADAVDAVYQEAIERGRPVRDYFVENKTRVADNLLGITDGRPADQERRDQEDLRSPPRHRPRRTSRRPSRAWAS